MKIKDIIKQLSLFNPELEAQIGHDDNKPFEGLQSIDKIEHFISGDTYKVGLLTCTSGVLKK